MIRTLLVAGIVLSLVSVLGCSEISGLKQSSSSSVLESVRRAELGKEWQMLQARIQVGPGDESLVLLRLTEGGEVDGYFYLEEGTDIGFQITGNSLIYESIAQDVEDSTDIASDRFSFVANQMQGTTYILTFLNPTDDDEVVFVEVIYPINGSLFFPVATE